MLSIALSMSYSFKPTVEISSPQTGQVDLVADQFWMQYRQKM